MFSAIAQAVIACTGVTAILLTQSGRPAWARWACWFGMAGEPAWFYSTIVAHQWGVFCLAFLYTFAWGKGIWTYWIKPHKMPPHPMERMLDHRCDTGNVYTVGCLNCGSAAMRVTVGE